MTLILVCYVNFAYWLGYVGYLNLWAKTAGKQADIAYFYPSHIHQRTGLDYKLCLLIGSIISIVCFPYCLIAIILYKILS